MSGIAGIVSPANREDLEVCIQTMIQLMTHKSWHKIQKSIMPGAGVATISVNDQKTISEQKGTALTVIGEIFDQDKLRTMLLESGYRDTSRNISDILLGLYLQFGVESLCGLNGLYLISIWEDDYKRLTIINDRYGFKKLYYWLFKDRFMFASEYKSLIWHPQFNKKINEVALSDFLSVNYLLDDRTFFEDIKVFPPASIMTYQEGQNTFHRYWDYEFHTGETKKSKEYYIDEYALRVKEAVRKRCKENMCLPITGGFDSRTLAAMAGQYLKFPKIVTCTVGHKHCYDVRFGRSIAKSLGYSHTFIPIDHGYIETYADKGIWELEGLNCFAFWIFALCSFLEENKSESVMCGFLGDCLSGAHLFPLLWEAADSEKAVELLYDTFFNTTFKDRELAILLKPHIYRNVRGESFASVKRCFNTLHTDNILNKCTYVDLHQRQRRYISFHIEALGQFSEVLEPFTDNEFIDFVQGIPVEMKRGQMIYKKMIAQYLSKVKQVPTTITGLPIDTSQSYEAAFKLWHRFYSRVLPRLTAGKLGHNYKHYIHEAWLKNTLENFVISTLKQKEYLEDYFNIDVVNNLVADHMSGKRNAYMRICVLMTFLLWRKRFCS